MAKETHNWLVNRILDRKLRELAATHLRGRLIDIGCGAKPYRDLLDPYIDEHVGVDLEGGIHGDGAVDLFGDAYEIPSEDGSFDSAICTAVLEHLEEPEMAIREFFRVLSPGGVAIYSEPFIWHIHEAPRDFYRFSPTGLSTSSRTPVSMWWRSFRFRGSSSPLGRNWSTSCSGSGLDHCALSP